MPKWEATERGSKKPVRGGKDTHNERFRKGGGEKSTLLLTVGVTLIMFQDKREV